METTSDTYDPTVQRPVTILNETKTGDSTLYQYDDLFVLSSVHLLIEGSNVTAEVKQLI